MCECYTFLPNTSMVKGAKYWQLNNDPSTEQLILHVTKILNRQHISFRKHKFSDMVITTRAIIYYKMK